MPLMPVSSTYRTQGLEDSGMATRAMKKGSIQILLMAAIKDRSPRRSESQPKATTWHDCQLPAGGLRWRGLSYVASEDGKGGYDKHISLEDRVAHVSQDEG